jgi:hypothetical protein
VLQEVPEPVEGPAQLESGVVPKTAAVGEAAGDGRQAHKLAAVLFMVQAAAVGEAIMTRRAPRVVLLDQQ